MKSRNKNDTSGVESCFVGDKGESVGADGVAVNVEDAPAVVREGLNALDELRDAAVLKQEVRMTEVYRRALEVHDRDRLVAIGILAQHKATLQASHIFLKQQNLWKYIFR